jgi:thiol:disulfide interchange protein
VKFESENFSSVLEKAKAEKKKIFVDCYTSWCGPCKMLASKIFTDLSVGEFMNSEFTNFKVDMEKGEGIELRKKFKVNVFPTLLILDSNGNEINRI